MVDPHLNCVFISPSNYEYVLFFVLKYFTNVSKFISVKVVLLAPPVFSPKHLIGLDYGLAIKTHSLYRPLFIDPGVIFLRELYQVFKLPCLANP